MTQFLGFGNGSDGVLNVTGATTDAPVDASCSGTSGATSLSATNVSFAANQKILIHQSRGTGVGQWEVNQIVSYVAGTITTLYPLSYTYTDSGASQAQVLVMKEYSGITIANSQTLTAKAWGGDVGGIIAYCCSGITTITGTITASGKGYLGGAQKVGAPGYAGEGNIGAQTQSTSANGTGGGGGGDEHASGGGGYGSAGTNASYEGLGGGTGGLADLSNMIFGGGGGSASNNANLSDSAAGGYGAGIVVVFPKIITITGGITCNGTDGNLAKYYDSYYHAASGGGAGGSILIKGQTVTLGTNLVTATGGAGAWNGKSDASIKRGGNGGVGRIRIEACSLTGTTNPAYSPSVGGQSYCGSANAIME